jgi:hypothetical protein
MIQALINSRTEFENLKESGGVITPEIIKNLISRTYVSCFNETGVEYQVLGQSRSILEFDTYGKLTGHLNFEEFQELSSLEQEMFLELDPFHIENRLSQYLTCQSISGFFGHIKSYLDKLKTENVSSITEEETGAFSD